MTDDTEGRQLPIPAGALVARAAYRTLDAEIDVATDQDLMYLEALLAYARAQRNREPEPDWERDGWDPWEALRRRPEIRFSWRDIPQHRGLITIGPRGAVSIDLHDRLSRRRAASALTHELIHYERGVFDWTLEERAVEEAHVRVLTRWRMAFWRPDRTVRVDACPSGWTYPGRSAYVGVPT